MKSMKSGEPKGMRWVTCGTVWQVYDADRHCVGAWSKEAPALAAFERLGKGAEMFKCQEFGGWPAQFMHHMKRVAIESTVKE